MDTRNPGAPWGTTRMAPYAETEPVALITPAIDPQTQVARVVDEHGLMVELHDHHTGSSTSSSTSTSTADSYDSDHSSDSDHD
ncbi:putative ATP-grasp-modified RiPP [Streptomyces sp. NPDC017202]|uniref:putative ATP-grasp-modified RiPP n=1 Tax=Streptomyces sp. NPDC017202 TaxID=3364981 RepID=UPI0037AAE451